MQKKNKNQSNTISVTKSMVQNNFIHDVETYRPTSKEHNMDIYTDWSVKYDKRSQVNQFFPKPDPTVSDSSG